MTPKLNIILQLIILVRFCFYSTNDYLTAAAMLLYSFTFLLVFGKITLADYATLNIWYGSYSVQSPGMNCYSCYSQLSQSSIA